jgi:signal transduction histidine kinase
MSRTVPRPRREEPPSDRRLPWAGSNFPERSAAGDHGQIREIAETRRARDYRTALLSAFPISMTVCLATVAAVSVAVLRTPGDAPKLAVSVLFIGTGAVFGVGLWDLARARDLRFARVLVAAGLLWALTVLGASVEPGLYSVGRVGQWLVDLAIVYLLLSYPSGHLTARTDRLLFAGGALVVALLYLPTAFVVQHFPIPSAWSLCTSGCPRNAFALGDSTPGLVNSLIIPAREALSVGLFLGVVVVVRQRGRGAGPLVRRMYAPIASIAVFRAVTLAVYFLTRRLDATSWATQVLSWAYVLSLPAVALACVGGRLYPRLFTASALDRIARSLTSSASAAHVGQAMSSGLEDPSLRILHSFPGDSGSWVDESGSPAELRQAADAQEVTEIASGNWRIAVLHDPALSEDPALVRGAGSYALAALENHRLTDELRQSLHDLAQSRASRLAAEQGARQKIERDLHDGAQQRLVALRIKLCLAADVLEDHDRPGAEALRALTKDVDATIDEVRSFARGIYPPLLAQTGLGQALRGASREAALPTTVHTERIGRYPAAVEATVYFSCSEALQNAAKHARRATGVKISVWQDEHLHFEVRDDGAGFDLQRTPYGTGLTNLSDRLAAVGGTMTIRSAQGHGTVLGGSIPLA